jgi:hypothetical protein
VLVIGGTQIKSFGVAFAWGCLGLLTFRAGVGEVYCGRLLRPAGPVGWRRYLCGADRAGGMVRNMPHIAHTGRKVAYLRS